MNIASSSSITTMCKRAGGDVGFNVAQVGNLLSMMKALLVGRGREGEVHRSVRTAVHAHVHISMILAWKVPPLDLKDLLPLDINDYSRVVHLLASSMLCFSRRVGACWCLPVDRHQVVHA